MTRSVTILLSVTLISLAGQGAGQAYGETLYVAPGGSIQAVIDDASDGDTIIVLDGYYMGTGNYNIDFKGKAITLRSENGQPNTCMINAQGKYGRPRRVFVFENGEGAGSVVDGFWITGGYTEQAGAGIFCTVGSSPTIQNCVISGNFAVGAVGAGGGIACANASPVIIDNLIMGNKAQGDYGGGGIYLFDSSAHVIGNAIVGGLTSADGGGIYAIFGDPIITNNDFLDCEAVRGGGMCNWLCPAIFKNNVVADNEADELGGGYFCWGNPPPVIEHCTFSENILTAPSELEEDEEPAEGEELTGVGREMCFSNINADVVNCIIWRHDRAVAEFEYEAPEFDAEGNPCDYVPEPPANAGGWDVALLDNSTVRLRYCVISMPPYEFGGVFIAAGCDASLMPYSAADPMFVAPGYLLDVENTWCDPLDDRWVVGSDWHLQAGSPAIDFSDPVSDYAREPYPDGGRANCGAYGNTPEATVSTPLGGVLIVEGPDDRGDPALDPAGGTFQVDIYAENVDAVNAIQTLLTFLNADYVNYSAYDYSFSTEFTVAAMADPDPNDYDEPAVIPNPALFPIQANLFEFVGGPNGQTAGFISYDPEFDIGAQTLFVSIMYDYPAGMEPGTYQIGINKFLSFIGGPGGGVFYEVDPGSLVIAEAAAASSWPCAGDANMDNTVNILDMLFIRNRINQDVNSGDNWQADVNQDGRINILDLVFVRAHWGACP